MEVWRKESAERLKQYTKDYYQKHSASLRQKSKDYRFKYPEKHKKSIAQWRLDNQERIKKYRTEYWSENKDHLQQIKKQHYRNNRDSILAKNKIWRERDEVRLRRRAHQRAREALKLKRIPKWADLEAIKRFYEQCPPGYHVDHWAPLKGKIVSGLHVIENLQYLPAHENMSKGNRFEPEI